MSVRKSSLSTRGSQSLDDEYAIDDESEILQLVISEGLEEGSRVDLGVFHSILTPDQESGFAVELGSCIESIQKARPSRTGSVVKLTSASS